MTVLIVIAVGFVYFPAVRGGFVLDDDLLLTHNSIVQSPDGLAAFGGRGMRPSRIDRRLLAGFQQ